MSIDGLIHCAAQGRAWSPRLALTCLRLKLKQPLLARGTRCPVSISAWTRRTLWMGEYGTSTWNAR